MKIIQMQTLSSNRVQKEKKMLMVNWKKSEIKNRKEKMRLW